MARLWKDVSESAEFKALSGDDQEAARNQYFNEVVAPQIETSDLEEARKQFDADTSPTMWNKTKALAGRAMTAIGLGDEQDRPQQDTAWTEQPSAQELSWAAEFRRSNPTGDDAALAAYMTQRSDAQQGVAPRKPNVTREVEDDITSHEELKRRVMGEGRTPGETRSFSELSAPETGTFLSGESFNDQSKRPITTNRAAPEQRASPMLPKPSMRQSIGLANRKAMSHGDTDAERQQLEGTEAGRNTLEGLGLMFKDAPDHLKAAAAQFMKAAEDVPFDDNPDDIGAQWMARSRQLAQQRASEAGEGRKTWIPGITTKDMADAGASLGFSGISSLTGLATGIPIGMVNPTAGWVMGGVASGKAAYDMSLTDYLYRLRDTYKQMGGTPEQWPAIRDATKGMARKYAAWEAGPEAVGNVLSLKLLTAPVIKALGPFGKSMVAKVAATYGTELGTETITQMGQSKPDSVLTGEMPKDWASGGDWLDALKEVAPATFLITTAMGGPTAVAGKVYDATVTKPRDDRLVEFATRAYNENKWHLIPDDVLRAMSININEVAERRDGEQYEIAAKIINDEVEKRMTGATSFSPRSAARPTDEDASMFADEPVEEATTLRQRRQFDADWEKAKPNQSGVPNVQDTASVPESPAAQVERLANDAAQRMSALDENDPGYKRKAMHITADYMADLLEIGKNLPPDVLQAGLDRAETLGELAAPSPGASISPEATTISQPRASSRIQQIKDEVQAVKDALRQEIAPKLDSTLAGGSLLGTALQPSPVLGEDQADIRLGSAIESTDARVEDARQRAAMESRLADLERAMRSPNPMSAFADLRTSQGLPVLPEDVAILKRRMGQAQAFAGNIPAGVEPSVPDGGMSDLVRKRAVAPQPAPADQRVQLAKVEALLAQGYRLRGKELVHPKTGKKMGLNQAQREHVERIRRGEATTADNVVDAAAHAAATSPHNGLAEPTQPQKEAGNFKKPGAPEAAPADHDRQGAAVPERVASQPDTIESTRVEDNDPRTIAYSRRKDGILVRRIRYDDGYEVNEFLVTDKDGVDQSWVSDDQYQRGEYYPVQLSESEAKEIAKSDIEDITRPSGNAAAKTTQYPGDRTGMGDDESDAAWEDWRGALFDAPEQTVKTEASAGDQMDKAEADAIVQSWKDTASAQDKAKNAGKTILSLFDYTGAWSQPYQDAGFNVVRVDLKDGTDINDFTVEYLTERLNLDDVYGVLAACPCTDFASSGARWWKSKDEDGRTAASVELVAQTLRTIEFFAPKFWAIENPVGRIEKLTGLTRPRLVFQPHHFGDPYTKRTHLYGKFDADLPTANVEPTEGSKIVKLRGDDPEQKSARSDTPEGFAYAFFMANGDVQPGTAVAPKPAKQDDTRAGQLKAEVERLRDKQPSVDTPATTQDEFGEGDRVVVARHFNERANGRHGTIVKVRRNTVKMVPVFGGQITEQTYVRYDVRTDSGTVLSAIEAQAMDREIERPQTPAVPDPVVNGQPEYPFLLLDSLNRAKRNASASRAAADRARKPENKADHILQAKNHDSNARILQQVWDEWAEKYPDEATKYLPTPKPQAEQQEPASNMNPDDRRATIEGAGLRVTKTTTKNGTPVWEVGGDTKTHHEILKSLGGRWYGPKKVWSFYDADPSERIATALPPKQAYRLAGNEVRPKDSPYIYRKEANGTWNWRVHGDNAPNALGANAEIIPELERLLSEKRGEKPSVREQLRQEVERARGQGKEEDLDAMFERILAEEVAKDEAAPRREKLAKEVARARAPRDPNAPKRERTAGAAAKSAAKNTAAGIDATIDALGALFGGKGKLSSGLTFDEETYTKAKPLFQQAIAHFKDASQDAAEAMRAVVRMVLDRFGARTAANMQPYVVRFIQDVKAGAILTDETGERDASGIEGDGGGTLEDVAADEVEGPGGERQPGRGTEPGGDGSRTGNPRSDGGRGKGLRGTGNRPATKNPTAAGNQGDRQRRAGRGVEGDGAGVPGPDAVVPAEVPSQNFVITEDVRLGSGGAITKYKDNVAAIRVLKRITAEMRRATADEQRILARYVGWGGLPNAFRNAVTGEVKADWSDKVDELESLLTPEELKAARASTRNAHFTAKPVVEFMWQAAERLGYNGGLVLEPSVGTGNFIGLMPEHLTGDSHVTGIELDSLTARMAGALYPRANIIQSGFQSIPIPSQTFDLAIGNPPFGKESLRFTYLPELSGASIHNQFFRASLDAVRPGGLEIMVVSRFLMDAQDPTNRQALATQARLLGAVRLPGSAFKGNALTEVVTDILFLQRRSLAEEQAMRTAFIQQGKRPKSNETQSERAERLRGEALVAEAGDWLNTREISDRQGNPMVVNAWFANNPDWIAGIMDTTGTQQKEGDIGVRLEDGDTLEGRLAKILAKLPEITPERRTDEARARSDEMHKAMGESLRLYAENRDIGAIRFEDDGTLTQVVERIGENGEAALKVLPITPRTPWSPQLSMNLEGKWYRTVPKLDEHGNPVKQVVNGKVTKRNVYIREVFEDESRISDSLRLGEAKYARMKQLVTIRDLLLDQINLEIGTAPVAQMEGNRTKLREAYEAFVKEHGYLSDPKNAGIVSEMPDEGLILSLETKYKRAVSKAKAKATGMPEAPSSAQPAAILSRPVAIPPVRTNHADTIQDALAISLAETGVIDLKRIQELRGLTEEAAVAELTDGDNPLAFKDPELGMALTEKNAYLSGNVRRKLKAAQDAGMSANVAALEKVQPEPWSSDQVTVLLGANWVPPEVYAAFLSHLTGQPAQVRYKRALNTFDVTGDNKTAAATNRWGTGHFPAAKLLGYVLNSARIEVRVTDMAGNSVKDQAATDAANDKAREMREEFSGWVFKDAERRRSLTQLFNDLFNTRVNRQFDGSHMQFPGKVPDAIIKLRRGQVNAIWRGIVEDYVLYDHAVGAGKTMVGIARAMERRRMGLSKKPMIVVPNHLVQSWAAEVYRLYPGAKVLAAGTKDMESKHRRRLFAKIATGDWDIVIVPHSSFGFIGVSPETEERFIASELDITREALQEAEDENHGNRFKSLSVKKGEALVRKLEARLDKVRGSMGKDRLLTFEQMGVDDLTVDESHEFKNLYYSTNLADVRGLGNQSGSQKAFDLYTKSRILHSSGGSVAFMTGTPISNSAVEMYTILRYLAPEALRDTGLENFDAFRTQYVDATAKFEPTDSGSGLKMVTRLGRQWSNMRGLMETYYSVADVVTNDDIKAWYREDNPGKEFPLPKVKGGGRQPIAVSPTPVQMKLLEEVIQGFNNLPSLDVKERNKERLRLMDRARKVSLHARALEPEAPDESGGKLDRAAEEIVRIYKQWHADRGTQLVFLDRSVPKSKGDDKLVKEYDDLVARREQALYDNDEEAYRRAIDALEKFDPNEIAELRTALAGGWNGYQHLKDRLVRAGIPEGEIAFIQKYNSDADKKALFDAVNDGQIRVLIGSSPRMGAGTNVQERLVALHHIDATWKPSDIEQREGRIIRQGNALLEKYGDAFEVEILAYVTERTVDAKLWDLNSTKLRMINAIRYYDGAFEMSFEDEDAVGMAEIAAIASGDTLLLERFKVGEEVEQLYRRRASWRRRVQSAEDAVDEARRLIEQGPRQIATREREARIVMREIRRVLEHARARSVTIEGERYTNVVNALMSLTHIIKQQRGEDGKGKLKLEIDGDTFTSQVAAEEYVSDAMGDREPFLAEMDGKTFTRRTQYARHLIENVLGDTWREMDERQAGNLMGVPVTVETTTSGYGRKLIELNGRLKGDDGTIVEISASHDVASEKDDAPRLTATNVRPLIEQFGRSMSRIEIAGDQNSLKYLRERIERAKSDLHTLEQEVVEPFKQADELEQKRARLAELEAQLSARDGNNAAAAASSAPTSDDGKLSRSTAPQRMRGHGVPMRDAKAVVGVFRSINRNAPQIHVLEDVRKAPDALLARIEAEGAMDDVEGAFHEGAIYLFPQNMQTAERVAAVLVHEGRHFAFAAMKGKALDAILLDIYNRNQAVKTAAQRKMRALGTKSVVEATEEALADMDPALLERGDLYGWKALVAHVRLKLREFAVALRRAGLTDVAKWLQDRLAGWTDADVAAMLRNADVFVRGGLGSGQGAIRMSLNRVGDDFFTEDFTLTKGEPHPSLAGVTRYEIGGPDGAYLGRVDLKMVNGHPEALISLTLKERGKGLGEKVVAGLLSDTGALYIYDMLPSSVGFWQKMGVRPETGGQWNHGNGTLTQEAYRAARPQGRGKVTPGAAPAQAQAADRRGTEGEAAPGELTARDVDRHKMASDMSDQSAWLDEQAQAKGYPDIDTLFEREPDEFLTLAEAWRAEHPARFSRAAGQSRRAATATGKLRPKRGLLDTPIRMIVQASRLNRLTGRAWEEFKRLGGALLPERVKAGLGDDYGLTEGYQDARSLMFSHQRQGLRGVKRLIDRVGSLSRAEAAVLYQAAAYEADPVQVDRLIADLPEDSQTALREIKQLVHDLGEEEVMLDLLDAETFERNEWAYLHRSYRRWELGLSDQERQARQKAKSIWGDTFRMRGLKMEVDPNRIVAPAEWFKEEAPIVKYREQASAIESSLPKPKEGFTRLWRGNRPDEVGQNPQFTNSLEGIALPFKDAYKGPLSYVDVPTKDINKYVSKGAAADGAEFILPKELAGKAKVVPDIDPNFWSGEMKGKTVVVLKALREDGKYDRFMYAGRSRPGGYEDWEVDGEWEIRDAKDGKFLLRRDYTAEEREKMGEIEDIRFATVKTLQHMIHNVEVAKFFEWVAATEARDTLPEGAKEADSSESLVRAFNKDEWVRVPDSKLVGTQVRRYGALAGKYVPGPVWNDIRQLANRNHFPLGRTYGAILKAWKISKTALSPTVHMNNVMANVIMADWHDVEAGHLLKAIRAVVNDDRALIDAFEDNGGTEGMYALTELQREQLQPIIDELEADLAQAGAANGMIGASAALHVLLSSRIRAITSTGPWREAWEAFRLGRSYRWPAKVVEKVIDLYQAEDTVFRLAAFIKAKEDGLTDRAAGKFARQSFLDYQINAPWVQMARQTVLPFVSFSYRAIPMLMETAAHKPWKIMKLSLILGAINALGYALSGGDEDEERKRLPKEKSGRVFGFVAPKLIRMPWNDENGSPVFLDIRRWIPVGDIVDTGQSQSAIPLPPAMLPGGPLVLLGEVFANKSTFTGKELVKDTDTGLSDLFEYDDFSLERYVKVMDHLYKGFMPNLPIPYLNTYAGDKIDDARTGKTDVFGREYDTTMAVLSGFGVKLQAYPQDVGLQGVQQDYQAQEREIRDNIRALGRQFARNGIDEEEFREKVAREEEKLRRAADKYKEKTQ